MIGLIIKTLNAISIISVQDVANLKGYVATNYPQISAEDLERVMAQLLNQTLENYLECFSLEYRQPIKFMMLTNAMALPAFEIFASDVFKAGFQLAQQQPAFFEELARWIGQFDFPPLSKVEVMEYIARQNPASVCPATEVQPIRVEQSAIVNTPEPLYAMEATQRMEAVPTQPENLHAQPETPKSSNQNNGSDMLSTAPGGAVLPDAGKSDLYDQLVTRYENFEKAVIRYVSKNKNQSLSILLVVLVFTGCLCFFMFKTRVKENLTVAAADPVSVARPKLVAPETGKTVDKPSAGQSQTKGSSDIASSNKALNTATDTVTKAATNTATDTVTKAATNTVTNTATDTESKPESKRDYQKHSPIVASPNAIVVGYVKEKTPNGLVDTPVRRYFERKLRIKASAYDLSVASCGKDATNPQYGITRTGTRAKRGRTIAVDPRIIPLGRKVYIAFPQKYKYLNGIYVAEDTGGAVKGYRIDVFFGEDAEGENAVGKEARKFGYRKVEVYLLQD